MSDLRETEGTGIGLRQYLEVVRRRKLIVIMAVAISLGAASALTLATTSLYQAQTTIVVGQGHGLVSPANANAIQPFSATMTELIKSTVVARDVIRDLHLPMTPEQLLGGISVSFNPESAALNVSVVNHLPERARAIAASLGANFSSLVAQKLGKGIPATAGNPATPPLTASVWDPAHLIPGKVEPKPTRNLLVAGVLGLVLGLLAAFLREYFDRTLRTVDEIERAFGVPVIGQIPTVKSANRDRSEILWDENGDFAESFRGLRANLQYLAVQWPLRTILVTSPAANQGKTTVSASLATAVAQAGQSVVLIEADLRRPRLAETFGLPRMRPGLTSVLVGHSQLGRATAEIKLPASRGQAKGGHEWSITVLPSGPLPPNPSELVGSPRMRRLVDGLADLYDTVILDSPPLLPVADSLALAKLVDGVIIVVRAKHATRDDAQAVRSLADRLGIHLVGVVVTDVPRRDHYYAEYSSELSPDGGGSDDTGLTPGTDTSRRRAAGSRKAAI